MIGWVAVADRFRSWIFESNGGFAREEWSKENGRWFISSSGVLFGGQKSSALRIITPVDNDTIELEAVDREVGGELLPDIEKVTIVRQKSSESSLDKSSFE